MRVYKDGAKNIYHIKVVYVGPAESGKTTNVKELAKIYAMKSISVDNADKRTVYADFTVPKVFEKADSTLNITTYSVPGQERFRPMREVIINRADILIFVADSHPLKMRENKAALRDVEDIVENYYQRNFIRDVTMVFQYNKRDILEKLDVRTLSYELNDYKAPEFEAEADKGRGVVETFVESVNMFLSFHGVSMSSHLNLMDFEKGVPQSPRMRAYGTFGNR